MPPVFVDAILEKNYGEESNGVGQGLVKEGRLRYEVALCEPVYFSTTLREGAYLETRKIFRVGFPGFQLLGRRLSLGMVGGGRGSFKGLDELEWTEGCCLARYLDREAHLRR